MGIRLGLPLLLLLSLALSSSASLGIAPSSSKSIDLWRDVEGRLLISSSLGAKNSTCNGLIGDCIDEEEELMMDSEASRRQLAGRRSRISRDAMRRSATPCGRGNPGGRYYGCPPADANPYNRGCNRINLCQRNTG